MAGMITDLGSLASGSVDRAADLLEIVDLSANTSYKITVNNLLGITGGSVVSTSDSQSLTNKTLDNTNTITLKDTLFTLQDDGDTTKQAKFQLSGITTGTTRTVTLPDATGTLVLTAATQTLTNKTLTSPTITGGTYDNGTITVDSISGHTSATIVTVANLQISNGVLNTANAVTATSIADGAIQPKALVTGTGSGWGWSTWTPTFVNMSGGTLNFSKYNQVGKTVFYRWKYTMAGAGIAGSVTFTLPVTANSDYALDINIGNASYVKAATQLYKGYATPSSTTVALLRVDTVSGSSVIGTGILANNTPFVWANLDYIYVQGFYEAA